MKRRLAAFAFLLAASWAGTVFAQQRALPLHGLSAFGDLKYGPGFQQFDYVNPAAPKGGELRQWQLESYDNLNPLILKGVAAQGLDRTFQSLMSRGLDEPDAVYAQLADSAELAPDRAWARFHIDGRARWHDGSPVTAEDVVFTFDAVRRDGHPQYQLILQDLEKVEAEDKQTVLFRFKPTESRRDLPLIVAGLPIVSKAWFATRDFARPTIEPLMGSGPYRIEKVEPGRSLTFRRVPDWWARDLPANRGQYNFDTIRDDYYRDRDIAAEAFFAGEYDYRIEITARVWAFGYQGKPAFEQGRIKREVLKDATPSGVQAYFLNARHPPLDNRKVREALNYAFDYEWMNKNYFYGLYKRTRSMFENSELAATGLPSVAELKLLEPYRTDLPDEVFTREYRPPMSDGSGNNRDNLRRAQELLKEAGWVIRDGKLLHGKTGEPFKLEFLTYEPSFARIINPFIRSLERIGIHATMRVVDLSAYENRMRRFEYDIMSRRFSQPLTPGVEQRNYWSSPSANVTGSFNFSGIRDKAVDDLVEHVVAAKSRDEIITAARALDRVLTWGWYAIPHWYSGTNKLGYWDRFGRPAKAPLYDVGLAETWWVDPAKNAAIGLRR